MQSYTESVNFTLISPVRSKMLKQTSCERDLDFAVYA